MDRRTFVGLTAATAASSLLSRTAFAQTAPTAKNVVLVHGLLADGSSWSEVIPRLQAAGLNVTSVQNPLTTFPEAVDTASRVLGRQSGSTVLAGHVSALVYVAAHAPDAGEDYIALAKRFPSPPASAGTVFDGGKAPSSRCSGHSIKNCSAAKPPTRRGGQSRAGTEDRTIDPDLQRFMAKRMGAKTTEVKASHVSLISPPATIANLILKRLVDTVAERNRGDADVPRPRGDTLRSISRAAPTRVDRP